MKKFLITFFLIIFIPFITPVFAQEIQCDNRHLTLVSSVRSRDLWIDKTADPLKNQYELIRKHNFSSTWLLQYDVLLDKELLYEIRKFNDNQEKGVFLEISQNFAEQSRVIYPHAVPWFSPHAVFLSGYSQSERRNLIDRLFKKFKEEFGFYPKSVGAWWIDSFSLNYMKEKYNIKTAMIVADQKTTDNYGIWGQWWGIPYYPSKANILTPASNLKNKQDVVVIQWAQRDPVLAYGEGAKYSNYSLQANDYIRQGKKTDYFQQLIKTYLDCQNPLGQITVGLETGIESVSYIDEYENQLKYLSSISNINIVTMSQFADRFHKIFPQFPDQLEIDSDWILKTDSRSNSTLKDRITYQQDIAFSDFFIPDKKDFLDRNLEGLKKDQLSYFPWFLIVIFLTGLMSLFKRFFKIWLIGTLFTLLSFGLIIKSNYQFGWQVFYGPAVSYLIFIQIILVLVSYITIWFYSRTTSFTKHPLTLYFLPLSFGLDPIIQTLRFSNFGGKYYFGFAQDSLRFIGLSFAKPFNLEFINQDFPSYISAAFLRFDFNKVWENLYVSILIYPLGHIILAIVFGYLFIKLPVKIRKFVIIIFVILTSFHLMDIFQADPRLVQ